LHFAIDSGGMLDYAVHRKKVDTNNIREKNIERNREAPIQS